MGIDTRKVRELARKARVQAKLAQNRGDLDKAKRLIDLHFKCCRLLKRLGYNQKEV